jgi:hypothetical protein
MSDDFCDFSPCPNVRLCCFREQGCVGRIPRGHRGLAAHYAVQDLVARSGGEADVEAAVRGLDTFLDGAGEQLAELVFRGGLRGVVAYRNWKAGFSAVSFVAASLIEPGRQDRP